MKKKSSSFKNVTRIRKCKHGCGNKPAQGRRECEKCRSKKIRERDPIAMVYYFLKGNAKRRKKEFTLDLGWFKGWVKECGYMENRGRSAESFTIDRIRNLEGYTPDNIQIMTKSENVCKYHYEDVVAELGPQIDEVPF